MNNSRRNNEMKKSTGKGLLALVLLKSAIVAGWYAYGKYLANINASSKNSVKSNEKQKEQPTEVKKEVSSNAVKLEVKSTPVKKVVAKKTAVKALKKVSVSLPVAVKEERPKKAPAKRKTKTT